MDNNRELKFRIWDKIEKKFTMVSDVRKSSIYEVHAPFLEIDTSKDSPYIIMQYTGLKDKNGKEIYEGDILRKQHYARTLYSYEKNGHIFKTVKWHHNKFTVPVKQDLDKWEIIGNIYQNEDLLT